MSSDEIPHILKLEIKFKTLEHRISLDFDKEIFLFRIGVGLNNIRSIYKIGQTNIFNKIRIYY